jgi:S1-C subfamily serine protease
MRTSLLVVLALAACTPVPERAPDLTVQRLVSDGLVEARRADAAMTAIGILGPQPAAVAIDLDGGRGTVAAVEGIGLVTATHVVGPSGRLRLGLPDGRWTEARLVRQAGDLALLDGTGPAALVPGACPRPGDPVAALGGVPPYRVFGMVARTGVRTTVDGRESHGFVFQGEIPLGFSGGPIVDGQGRIVGIVSGTWRRRREAFAVYLAPLGGPDCTS